MSDKVIRKVQDCRPDSRLVRVGDFAIPASMMGKPSNLALAKVQETEYQEQVKRFRKYWTGVQ